MQYTLVAGPMKELGSTPFLLAAERLSELSGRLVDLLQHLAQRLSTECRGTRVSPEKSRIAYYSDLLSALELQKHVVEEHFALVSMLHEPRRRERITRRQSGIVGTAAGKKQRRMVTHARPETTSERPSEKEWRNRQFFTERQRQIIKLVALEYSNREIGQSLGISEQTVKNHLSAIFGKMKVSRRSDLTLETFNSREPDVTMQTQSDLTRERPH